MTRIRLVVLDGFDWAYLNEGRAECAPLWDLADDGCHAELESCAEPLTPPGVAALLAGRDLDHDWSQDAYITSQELIRSRPWFPALDREGLSVGLANVPLTWPAFRMRGVKWLTSGFPVGAARDWHTPRGLDVLGYPIDRVVCDGGPGGTRDVEGLAQTEADIVRWVMAQERADVEVVWLRTTDGAGHHFWGRDEYHAAVGETLKVLPRLREGAENLIVVSDHGMAGLQSEACSTYRATNHGPAAIAAGLAGGHTRSGILIAAGDDIRQRGLLPTQRLMEVAGGLFDLLQVPPPQGMVSVGPQWAHAFSESERAAMRADLADLGY